MEKKFIRVDEVASKAERKHIRDHPDTRLIIIDTLQKIREVNTDAYSYANDYGIVGRMKQFVTIKMTAGAVSKIPSQSSQPSRKERKRSE